MTCPNCGSENVCVRETMHGSGGKIYRRRKCNDCQMLFRTVEDVLDNTEQSNKDYSDAAKKKSPLLTAFYDSD